MKELSIEEKAKAYDKAIERAKCYKGHDVKCAMEYVFPELKESEDERMIQYFKDLAPFDNADVLYSKYGFSHKDAIAWLEKQGEHKFPSLSEKEIVCLKRILDFLREEHNSYTGKDFTNEITVLEWLITHPILIHSSELQQKQGWQKPLRFNMGDEITVNGQICKVAAVEQNKPWSKDDEEMYKKVETAIDSYYAPFSRDAEEMSEWFKSLKDRVQPQHKREWSDKDEATFTVIGSLILDNFSAEDASETLTWLHSLRPQNTWKPSDEQIFALRSIVTELKHSDNKYQEIIEDLCNDLEKLMDEQL